jgi:tetratricopeptide (TPR) repeat protein
LRFHPQAGFLAACVFMLLAPTSSVVPIVSELTAERRMYLPLAALTALVVTCVGMRVPVRALAGVAAGLALVLGMGTLRHSRAYGDALLAWESALAVDPRNETAHINRGTVLVARGQLDAAMESFRRAAEVNRFSVLARHNIGMIHMSQRRFAEASEMFAEALRIQPRAVTAARQLAISYVLQNRMREAADAYAAALNLSGDWTQGLNDLAWIRATSPVDELRNGAEAVRLATRACELSGGSDAALLDTLGAAHAETGDFVAAIAAVDRAIAVAESSGSSDLTRQLLARRELYRQQKPYRDPAP